MANRTYSKFQALEKEVKKLYLKAAIGASGAPTISATASKGVASIARSAAGKYTITLSDKYNSLLDFNAVLLKSDGAKSSAGGFTLVSEDVAGAKTIVVWFLDNAGAAVEIDSGAVLRVSIEVKNSSV
jgi:hypothetical protein